MLSLALSLITRKGSFSNSSADRTHTPGYQGNPGQVSVRLLLRETGEGETGNREGKTGNSKGDTGHR